MFKKISMVVLFVTLAFNSALRIEAKELKIIQIADAHYEEAQKNEFNENSSEMILINTINDINGIKDKSFVIFTGDNINKPKKDTLKSFLRVANKLNCPYYVVIGDSEVSKPAGFKKVDYLNLVRKYSNNCRPHSPNYVFKKDGVVFIVLDGAKEVIPGTNGYFKDDTLRWLDRNLRKYKKNEVVIFQHFPVVAPSYSATKSTFDKDGYLNILEKHSNVLAIISGHYHENGEKYSEGVYHISTPALVKAPHDYKVIEIEQRKNKKTNVYTMIRHAN